MDLFMDVNDFDMISDFDHDPGDFDFDPNFAPIARERANTWHGPPRKSPKDEDTTLAVSSFAEEGLDETGAVSATASSVTRDHVQVSSAGTARKATARRNAWGNMSYADLIAKAIESSPDKRLTLAEIYAWLVENVPFFKDKGETNSSAGWKNSIRHNLSLHNRFMRVQNEGAGKSSWWIVNPDKGPSKVPRRRAATMDNTKVLNQKRGRQRRSDSSIGQGSTNPTSTNCELDGIHQNFFSRSPEFRGRVSSNASSIGRLSPIPATYEVDMDPVTSSTSVGQSGAFIQWNNSHTSAAVADTLSDSLAGILMDDLKPDLAMTSGLGVTSKLKTEPLFLQAGSNVVNFSGNFMSPGHQYPPPLHHSPVTVFTNTLPKTEGFSLTPPVAGVNYIGCNNMSGSSMLCVGGNMSGNGGGFGMTGLQMNMNQHLYKTPSVNDLLLQKVPDQFRSGSTIPFAGSKLNPQVLRSETPVQTTTGVSIATPVSWPQQQLQGKENWSNQQLADWTLADEPPEQEQSQTRKRSFTFSSGKLDHNTLRQLLLAKPLLRTDIQKLLQLKRQQLFATGQLQSESEPSPLLTTGQLSDFTPISTHQSMLEQLLTEKATEQPATDPSKSLNATNQLDTKMDETTVTLPSDLATFPGNVANLPSDLDLSYLNTESTTDIECNIDQVIQHELTFGDELDFSFDSIPPNWGSNAGDTGDSLTNYLSY